jgi:hypothetical protein
MIDKERRRDIHDAVNDTKRGVNGTKRSSMAGDGGEEREGEVPD